MGAPRDLTDQTFGRLTARRIVSANPMKWLCDCECGSTAVVASKDLLSGNTKSCGCLKRECDDLSGNVFGRLTAKEHVGRDPGGCAVWLCECECGNFVKVRSSLLKSGNTKSCGCLVKDAEKVPSDAVDGTRLGNLSGLPTKQNTSGVRGVSWDKQHRRWAAYIKFRGAQRHLGMFRTIEEAAEARREAEQELFDPVLEAHGLPPTSEAEYEASLREAIDADRRR